MIHTLPSPARSAARAHSPTRLAMPWPMSATPRLSVQRQSIRLAKNGQEAIEVAVGGRHRRQPGAARAGILQAARREDYDDRLFGVEATARGELHDRRHRGRRRRLDVEAFFTRQRALCLEDAFVGEAHAAATGLAQCGEALPRAIAR